MPSITFSVTNVPAPPDCPGAVPAFCGTLGDSNLGDDYPKSEGWKYAYEDGKVTKFVLNKERQTLFIEHCDTIIAIDKDGNLSICGQKDIKVYADNDLQLLARKDITIQSFEGDINIAAKKNVKVCADDEQFTVKAKTMINMQAEDGAMIQTAKDVIMITSEENDVVITAVQAPPHRVIINPPV
jgi:hypothetical protein